MRLRAVKKVCHYCESIQKLSKDGTFRPHSNIVDIVAHKVPSREIEPSLRDSGPTTIVTSAVWKVCMGSDRKPWPLDP